MSLKSHAKSIFHEALKATNPSCIIPDTIFYKNRTLHVKDKAYSLKQYKRIFLFGSGKSSYLVALELLDILEDIISGGLIVTQNKEGILGPITMTKGSCSKLDHDSLDAGDGLLNAIKELKKDDFYIYILSSGSSNMIESLKSNITIKELQKLNKIVSKSSISKEIENKIRQKISNIKGGGLHAKSKAKGIVLVVSDSVCDDLSAIGLAPFLPDKNPLTIEEIPHKALQQLPKKIYHVLKRQTKKPKKLPPPHHILISSDLILKNAKKEAKRLGYATTIVTSNLNGLAVDAAKKIVEDILQVEPKRPICKLYGGKTVVDVQEEGKGGKNQHMCLYALSILKNSKNIAFLSAKTSGFDGNSKAAGAYIDNKTYKYALKSNLDIMNYLKKFDSYTFFKKSGGLIAPVLQDSNVINITIVLKNQINKKDRS